MWPSQDVTFNMYKEQSFPLQVMESASLAGEEVQMPVTGVASFPFRMSLCLEFQACEMSQDAGGWRGSLHLLHPQAAGQRGFFVFLLFSHWVMFDSSELQRPTELQHAKLPCPSPSPRVCSNSCSSLDSTQPSLLCHPLLFLTSVFPSIRVFSNELSLHIRWPKYWSCSFSFSSSSEYSGLISFRID